MSAEGVLGTATATVVPPTKDGQKVQPDRQTKIVLGSGYVLVIAIGAFLALQVWLMNGRQERQDERFAGWRVAQDAWNARIERTIEKNAETQAAALAKLTDEFRAFKDEMLKKGDGK